MNSNLFDENRALIMKKVDLDETTTEQVNYKKH